MKPYRVTVEVTTTYTVEVHAETAWGAEYKALNMDIDEVEAAGSVDKAEVETTYGAEEIQREDEE